MKLKERKSKDVLSKSKEKWRIHDEKNVLVILGTTVVISDDE